MFRFWLLGYACRHECIVSFRAPHSARPQRVGRWKAAVVVGPTGGQARKSRSAVSKDMRRVDVRALALAAHTAMGLRLGLRGALVLRAYSLVTIYVIFGASASALAPVCGVNGL